MKTVLAVGALGAGLIALGQVAMAGDGPLMTASGAKAQGMAGVSLAFPQDAMAGASNPAGMAFAGHRLDVGAQFVGLWGKSEVGAVGWNDKGSAFVPVPEIGYNRPLNDQWSIGVSTLMGGAAFNYDNQIITGDPSSPTEGFYLAAVILPTVTYRPNPDLAVGFSAALAVQGLDISNLPGVPNHGLKWAHGLGFRAGVLWNATENVSLGAVYASKIGMSSLSGYEGDLLAAGDGALDMPEQYGVGIKVKVSDRVNLGADLLRINWSDTQWNTHFGYRDQNVFRVGADYALDETWTLRAGARTARRQFGTDDVAQNLLLAGINTNAVSVGATKLAANGGEWSFGFEYDFGSPARGTGPSTSARMDIEFVTASVSYGIRF